MNLNRNPDHTRRRIMPGAPGAIGGTTYQMCSIATNSATGGYDAELTVGIYA